MDALTRALRPLLEQLTAKREKILAALRQVAVSVRDKRSRVAELQAEVRKNDVELGAVQDEVSTSPSVSAVVGTTKVKSRTSDGKKQVAELRRECQRLKKQAEELSSQVRRKTAQVEKLASTIEKSQTAVEARPPHAGGRGGERTSRSEPDGGRGSAGPTRACE